MVGDLNEFSPGERGPSIFLQKAIEPANSVSHGAWMVGLKSAQRLFKHLAGQRADDRRRPMRHCLAQPPQSATQRVFAAALVLVLARVIHEIVKVPVGKLLVLQKTQIPM